MLPELTGIQSARRLAGRQFVHAELDQNVTFAASSDHGGRTKQTPPEGGVPAMHAGGNYFSAALLMALPARWMSLPAPAIVLHPASTIAKTTNVVSIIFERMDRSPSS
jgi:hypothetical protein